MSLWEADGSNLGQEGGSLLTNKKKICVALQKRFNNIKIFTAKEEPRTANRIFEALNQVP